ncbi:MAG: hypothetical protein AAF628_19140 [Planctomycetota bacterium]
MTPPADRRFDLRVLLLVAAPLTGAAVLELTAANGAAWPQSLMKAAVWAATLTVLWLASRRRVGERTVLAALGLIALFAVAAHYHFGRFHGKGRFIHEPEYFLYYVGSKYFDELGYEGLYPAGYRALVEDDPSFAETAPIVKNLRSYALEGGDVCWQRSESVAAVFSETRWQEFKADVRYLYDRMAPVTRKLFLLDHGYNPTPFWTTIGVAFSQNLAMGPSTLLLLGALDPLLIVGMLLLVWRSFGRRAGLLFAIFFFANFFSTFDIMGGAFLRYLWLAASVAFACFYRQRRPALAGLCLAVAVLDRAFPAVFGLALLIFWLQDQRRRNARSWHGALIVWSAGWFALLGGATLWIYGLEAWLAFYRNIQAHDQWFYTNQISLRNLFVVHPWSALESGFTGWDEASWLRERQALAATTEHVLLAVRAVLFGLLVLAVASRRRRVTALSLLAFGPFVLLYPSNYYHALMAVAVLAWRHNPRLAYGVLAVQGGGWALTAVMPSTLHMEFVHWVVSLGLTTLLVTELLRDVASPAQRAAAPRAVVAGGAVAVVVLGAGVVWDVASPLAAGDDGALDVAAEHVQDLRGATARSEMMMNWGSGWSRNDHLLVLAQAPGAAVTLSVPAPAAGRYRIKVVYSASPAYGIAKLTVNGQVAGAPVNLFASRVGLLPVVYPAMALQRGVNALAFSVSSKDPASAAHHFAVDRVVLLEPLSDRAAERRRVALGGAMAWLRDHPADVFDGGHEAIAAEIVALAQLREGAEGELRAEAEALLTNRLECLEAAPPTRLARNEASWLAAAALAARAQGREFDDLPGLAAVLRQWAATPRPQAPGGAPQPESLCAGLQALGLGPPCPAGGLLAREHAERQLHTMLAGPVDHARRTVVANTLEVLVGDAIARTELGRRTPNAGSVLADGAFWAPLLENGIRWAREGGQVTTAARLALMASCLGLEAQVPSHTAALGYLIHQQEPDGAFGAADPRQPNASRVAVLFAIMALAASEPDREHG